MRDAIGRPAWFLADGVTTTTHRGISAATHARLGVGGVLTQPHGNRAQGGVPCRYPLTRISVADIAFDECVCSYRASLGHHVADSPAPFVAVKPLASLDPFGLPGLTAPHGRLGRAFT
jgi:hypothetical protein